MRGFPSPSRVAEQRLLPPQPGRTVPWRGQTDNSGVTHRRDEAAGFPPPCRWVPGAAPRGSPCSRCASLSVASAAAAGQLEAPIAPSVAAVPLPSTRPVGRWLPLAVRARPPGREPGGRSATASLPSVGRCSRGGRRRAEERRGNGAWSR